ncbi:MAG: NADH-quinone oxidoreductase subunit N [Actinomycetota bacterium]
MAVELVYLIPEITVLLTALAVLVLDMFLPDERKPEILAGVSIAGLMIAFAFAVNMLGERVVIMTGMYVVDAFGTVLKSAILFGSVFSLLLGVGYLRKPNSQPGEYDFLMLVSTFGMLIMCGSVNLLVTFMGIQLTSIPLYILTGFKRGNVKSGEAALKYFLLGIMTAAVTLYGMSLIYGLTGTLQLPVIAGRLTQIRPDNPVLFIGMVFLIAGFSFKIAAVPFHFWAPDVYEGAPTCVSSFIAAVPKIAGFAVLARLVFTAFPEFTAQWMGLLAVMSVLTMVTGNILAIPQANIKRMLAFSGIAHVGYALITLAVPSHNSLGALVFYMFAYGAMTGGAWAVVTAVGRAIHDNRVESFAGLASRAPVLAAAMTVFMLSMVGFPLTAGFVAKFLVFSAAVQKDYVWLAVVGVLNSVLSLFYYLNVIRQMYFKPSLKKSKVKVSALVWVIIGAAITVTVLMGVFPEPFVHLARSISLLYAKI